MIQLVGDDVAIDDSISFCGKILITLELMQLIA